MRRPTRTHLIVIAVVAAGALLAYVLADGMYLSKRAELMAQLETARGNIKQIRDAEIHVVRTERAMLEAAEATLGSTEEVVDHRLRVRLNRIGERIGLADVSVSTTTTREVKSPATKGMPGYRAFRPLKKEIDFVELGGAISGTGTLAQAIELVDRITAEPWPKQVRYVKLDPSENGVEFRVTVRMATMYLPGREPTTSEDSVAPYETARLAGFADLIASNPFHVPPPVETASVPVPPPAQVPQPDLPPAGFPWRDWTVTGVAEGPGGMEVWLLNHGTNESRTIMAGESLDEAVFVGASDLRAVFRVGDETFVVEVGANLAQRSPVGR